MVSDHFIFFFSKIHISIAVFSLIQSFRYKHYSLMGFSIAHLVTCMQLLNIPNAPESFVATYYVALVISYEMLRRIKMGAKLVKSAQFIRDNFKYKDNFKKLIIEIADLLGAGRVSLLTINKHGGCRIISLKNHFKRKKL